MTIGARQRSIQALSHDGCVKIRQRRLTLMRRKQGLSPYIMFSQFLKQLRAAGGEMRVSLIVKPGVIRLAPDTFQPVGNVAGDGLPLPCGDPHSLRPRRAAHHGQRRLPERQGKRCANLRAQSHSLLNKGFRTAIKRRLQALWIIAIFIIGVIHIRRHPHTQTAGGDRQARLVERLGANGHVFLRPELRVKPGA